MKKLFCSFLAGTFLLLLASCDDSAIFASITLSSTEVNLKVGETEQLSALIMGAKSKTPELNWYSHDDSIATVSQTGLITGTGVGETEVIVETIDGSGGKSVCLVNVE